MEKDKKLTLQIYYVFALAVLLNFVPSMLLSSFGAILLLFILIGIYIYRAKAEKDGLVHNHMNYLIKSFWGSSLLVIIGMGIIYLFGNHEIIYGVVRSVKDGQIITKPLLDALIADYLKRNLIVIVIALSPSAIYLIYRTAKGLLKAKKEQRIDNLKSWL